MAQESFLKQLNSIVYWHKCFQVSLHVACWCTDRWCFIFMSIRVCDCDTHADCLHSFSLVLCADRGSAWPVLSLDLCRTIPPLCLAKSRIHHRRELLRPGGIRGDFEMLTLIDPGPRSVLSLCEIFVFIPLLLQNHYTSDADGNRWWDSNPACFKRLFYDFRFSCQWKIKCFFLPFNSVFVAVLSGLSGCNQSLSIHLSARSETPTRYDPVVLNVHTQHFQFPRFKIKMLTSVF